MGTKNLYKKGHKGYWKGKQFSKEHLEHLSEARKGKPLSKATRLKISNSHKKIINWNYQGGITELSRQIRQLFEYRQWRSDVFKRDWYKCQLCSAKRELEAHHIKKFFNIIKEYKIKTSAEAIACVELWDINNGITYCNKCHKKIEKK
jgi:5-methylcytosine-specific restriction endonuclease McrA